MKILAMDSSGNVASVAILEGDVLKAEYTIDYKKTHSQTLLPMLDEIKRMTESDLEDIDAIAVATGPGSFTGLRIGAATAKGLGLALNKPIIPVPTTDALAFNMYGHNGLICPIMDARRNQVYTGLYGFISAGGECDTCDSKENYYEFIRIKETSAMSIEELCSLINERHEEVIFLGDGVPVYRKRIDELLTVPYMFAPAHLSRQHAGSVGMLGLELFAAGKYESAAQHSPKYYRVSQAERERKEKAIIRPMKEEDLDVVSEMEAASYPDPWSRKGFEEELGTESALAVVMEDTTGVVGYALATLTGEDADIVKITIDEKERGKGYGRKLLDMLMNELYSRGILNATLEVRMSNAPAISLYEHAGFVSEGVRPGFYSNPKEDAVIYWLRK
ncbi:MAG: tRNA (adenosine(37)-N6)-threonylcarbamoyltransferase complex dimerization subunit type 1 TsaB [Lachnospiraceae bacterium]|nr:tRNA (adenosine(37)-N6)-threonylcarbamoyltransferase complex dimerization subunit type 1 TsaB [Lachnospiraceae bacterium]